MPVAGGAALRGIPLRLRLPRSRAGLAQGSKCLFTRWGKELHDPKLRAILPVPYPVTATTSLECPLALCCTFTHFSVVQVEPRASPGPLKVLWWPASIPASRTGCFGRRGGVCVRCGIGGIAEGAASPPGASPGAEFIAGRGGRRGPGPGPAVPAARPRRRAFSGTAHGRDAELHARNARGEVYGVDINTGVESAYRTWADWIGSTSFRRTSGACHSTEFFDFIGCDQVIHHTPDTRLALHNLLRHLAPGGLLAFYVCRKKGAIREFCDDFIRERTTRMSPEDCRKFSEA